MTHPTLHKLTKVLELERRQGCEDRAVDGGLDAFVARWRDEAGDALPEGLAQGIVTRLANYQKLAPHVRRARVDAALRSARRERTAVSATDNRAKGTGASVPDVVSDGGSADNDGPDHSPSAHGSRGRAVRKAPRPRPDFPIHDTDDPGLDGAVTAVRGIGDKAAAQLARLGITTVRELLQHVPSRYRDFSQVVPIGRVETGSDVTVVGTVADVRQTRGRSGRQVLWVLLEDTTGRIRLSFFNQPYLAKSFARGRTIAASGKIEKWAGRAVINAPEWEAVGRGQIHTARLLPIYPAAEGISQRWLRRHVGTAVAQWAPKLGDPLPSSIRESEGLVSLPEAIWAVHLPSDDADRAAGARRLGFDELLGLQLWARQRRRARAARHVPSLGAGSAAVDAFIDSLPWPLTEDQRSAIEVVRAELEHDAPMSRLLQGDVGCGKTVVAAAAMVQCVAADRQAALMAPTEILARQHFRSLAELLAPAGWAAFDPSAPDSDEHRPRMALLVGGLSAAAKDTVRAAAREGRVAALIGTQALIQESVEMPRLALSVVDEQHRFGVVQRAVLDGAVEADETSAGEAIGAVGPAVHSLVMTATPIPRTLAHVVNADLDQTIIQSMPKGRKPIVTEWLTPDQRERAYQYIRHRVAEHDDQAYIIFPLVEESEHIDARAAADEFDRLRDEVFPGLSLALVHGRLSAQEKEAAMLAFHNGEARILVATTVVEVGVDVPNASIMLIDGAERFGLAQLHQLRGRIGRGSKESVCLLLTGRVSAAARDRLAAMTELVDDPRGGGQRLRNGLELAERDLALRGPGDYFGTQQSGLVDRFRFARLGDVALVNAVARVAEDVLDSDPDLTSARHKGLRALSLPYHEGAARK